MKALMLLCGMLAPAFAGAAAAAPIVAITHLTVIDTTGGAPSQSDMTVIVKDQRIAGLTSLQALQTATFNPAKFMNRLADLGTVERGKLADLVLLDANPLEDIANADKIRAVELAGRYLDRAELDRMLKGVAEAAADTSHAAAHGAAQ